MNKFSLVWSEKQGLSIPSRLTRLSHLKERKIGTLNCKTGRTTSNYIVKPCHSQENPARASQREKEVGLEAVISSACGVAAPGLMKTCMLSSSRRVESFFFNSIPFQNQQVCISPGPAAASKQHFLASSNQAAARLPASCVASE